MQLRYGMRLGHGLWVSGGPGIVAVYVFSWMLAFALGGAIAIGLLIACAIGLVIQSLLKRRRLHKKHKEDVALARRIAAQKVGCIEFLGNGRTNPPALWGVYMIEPSHGLPYATCGQHPAALRKLWLENRCGAVHELIVLPDKPMAIALLELLKRGVCSVKPAAAGVVSGFAANGMPILRTSVPESNS